MDMERMRQQKLREIAQQSRTNTINEIGRLETQHQVAANKAYTFEYGGQQITGEFISAALESHSTLPNGYVINVSVPAYLEVCGQAQITDTQGQRLGASASTNKGKSKSVVTLSTIHVEVG
jgi:hypothetical protein